MKEDGGNQHPDFHVLKSLEDLVLLVMNILHTSLIGLKTLDGNDTLPFCEELGCVRGIWEYPPESASETDRYDSELGCVRRTLKYRGATYNDEHPLIRKHFRNVDVSDAEEDSSR